MNSSRIDDLEREPFISELTYFATNPNVAGMMTEDQRVILQPTLQGSARDAVLRNEAARLALQNYKPTSSLTNEQLELFKDTPYQNDRENALRSILARIISGDPSAQATFEQDTELRKLRQPGGLLSSF